MSFSSEGQWPSSSLRHPPWLLLFLNLPLPNVTPFLRVCICRTLQTVGPSHARTYTVAVYFKGERIGCGKGPRWVRRCSIIRHNRTRRCASRCTANGLRNNGRVLLMVFIIAIKLLLAYSIGRDIMQNEKASIRYWFDASSVMEISLSAGASRCIQVYLGHCARSSVRLAAFIGTFVKETKWICAPRPFQGWRGWR